MFDEYTKEEIANVISSKDEHLTQELVRSLDYSSADIKTATLAVASLLLFPSNLEKISIIKVKNVTKTPYEKWFSGFKKSRMKYHSFTASRWISGLGLGGGSKITLSLYCIFLFNSNYGKTRELFLKFLTYEDVPPPYLDLVIVNLFHQGLGLSHTEIKNLFRKPFSETAKILNQLFSSRSFVVENWLDKKKQSLRFYGGETNTVLGLYDDLFYSKETGFDSLNKKADIYYDLGGGFNTSEMERITGFSFISADIISPNRRDSDAEIIIQVINSKGVLGIVDTEIQSFYVDEQSKIRYLKFNVLLDSFPLDKKSYVITSAGFTTSTVRPKKEKGENIEYGHVFLSVRAIQRVMELVHQGKDVDFFTIQRSTSRAYKYKTCLLQWRAGKLTNLITTKDFNKKHLVENSSQYTYIYKSINSENKEFKSYLPKWFLFFNTIKNLFRLS